MASLTARVVRRMIRSRLKPTEMNDDFVATLRRRVDGPAPPFLGRGAGRRTVDPDEVGAVTGEWVGVPAARRHVLYLHGGYYLAGGTPMYRNLAARLATGLGADVLLAEYRKAPEHPYPAAVDDALAAYRGLLDAGADPAALAVAGDSAGGGLTMALLLRLKSLGLPLPAAVAVFSPWVDLTGTGASLQRNDDADDMLTAEALRTAARHYAGTTALDHPEVSPIHGDLSGLPPLFVTVDESECLLDDATRLSDGVIESGGRCELRTTTGLFHVWPALVPLVPEARSTVDEVVEFLDRELD